MRLDLIRTLIIKHLKASYHHLTFFHNKDNYLVSIRQWFYFWVWAD